MKLRNILLVAASATTFLIVTEQSEARAEGGVPSVVAGTSGLPAMDVVDISSNNGVLSVADFKQMRADGVKGIVVKLSEFTTYHNPYAAQQIANAQAAGLQVSVYHYSWFTSPETARTEAKYFANTARSLGLSNSTLLINDLEVEDTKTGNVTANAAAFDQQLKDLGYNNTGIYTSPSYVRATGLNLNFVGNSKVWMADYPYHPSSDNLWDTQYGMWQWTSRATFPGVKGEFDASTDYSGMASGQLNRQTGYVQNADDGQYYWLEDGNRFTGFRFYMGAYYWFQDGVRQDNSWHQAWGLTYYTGADGRAVEGIQNIDGTWYDFGNNRTFNLKGLASGYLYTPSLSTANGGYNWIQDGQAFSGFRYYMGTYYWFDNGVRQNRGWRSAWNLTYFTDDSGRALQGSQYIDGVWRYFGNDGTYYLR
ncbi:GH25 family lysozyme [Convivina intestini]|uniref:GH25 family lysozyme n=1 Tax=Convivina intestini TaxID=1505726 RepID=UPI00200D1501|nr:GH25 family lysozyme [Convivina intestini]CAH1850321.1 hypothetical protein R078131_00066 [Convivina intestini]